MFKKSKNCKIRKKSENFETPYKNLEKYGSFSEFRTSTEKSVMLATLAALVLTVVAVDGRPAHWVIFDACLTMLELCKPSLYCAMIYSKLSTFLTRHEFQALFYHTLFQCKCTYNALSPKSDRWTVLVIFPKCWHFSFQQNAVLFDIDVFVKLQFQSTYRRFNQMSILSTIRARARYALLLGQPLWKQNKMFFPVRCENCLSKNWNSDGMGWMKPESNVVCFG